MKVLFTTALLALLLSFTVNAEEKNYCHDSEANQEWNILINKYPGDLQLSTLHALRLGLCYKIELGQIEIGEATKIFESVKNQLVNRKVNEKVICRRIVPQPTTPIHFLLLL
ncbi:MAG: hypothetical protein ACUZ8O_09875 [Candidatus Anammoxibacter sp.]